MKFDALSNMHLEDPAWIEAPCDWRAPFLPISQGAWSTFPRLEDLFVYNGSGIMPGRTWIIAPDAASLAKRWKALIEAPADRKEALFHPHLRNGQPGDKQTRKMVPTPLHGFERNKVSVADDTRLDISPLEYGFRSFDRQWIIPDSRVINQPNPELWRSRSEHQIYLTAPSDRSPSNGLAVTFTSLIPDLHHYAGRGGRAFPLWADEQGELSNVRSAVLRALSEKFGFVISPDDLVAYIAAVAASPAYTARFQKDLSTPGLRIPVSADTDLFKEALQLGRRVLWLQTFGERMHDATQDRPAGPPRLPGGSAPVVPKEGTISSKPSETPETLNYDVVKHRLLVGSGFIDKVLPAVWEYEVSGKQVLLQWFSYRKKHRDRPIIGDRRQPSALGDIQPDHWLPEYTTELLNVLNVLTMLVELEPDQAALLDRICKGALISEDDLRVAGAFASETAAKRSKPKKPDNRALFE